MGFNGIEWLGHRARTGPISSVWKMIIEQWILGYPIFRTPIYSLSILTILVNPWWLRSAISIHLMCLYWCPQPRGFQCSVSLASRAPGQCGSMTCTHEMNKKTIEVAISAKPIWTGLKGVSSFTGRNGQFTASSIDYPLSSQGYDMEMRFTRIWRCVVKCKQKSLTG